MLIQLGCDSVKIEIKDMDHKGNGIGNISGKVVFVPKTITGDVCDVSITKEYKNYSIAKVNKIIKKADSRIDNICPYYFECGGCNISNLDYQKQLEFKKNKVKNIFKKYLDMEIDPVILGSKKEYGYRNKITYHNNKYLGLISEYDGIVNIDKCLLVSDKVNNLYHKIKELDLANVKMITIRECDNGLILGIIGKLNIDTLKDDCISIYMNNKCVVNKKDGYITLGKIKYLISNRSFFQINTSNIVTLYDNILECGNFGKNDTVIDLYCGVGSISLYIAKYVKKVIGVEIVEDAIRDAKKNAIINNINNVEFICSDVANSNFNEIYGDILIVDPPRIGIDNKTIMAINNKNVKELIYVSCDPLTLVRDIKLLTNYQLDSIVLVDMFPQTHHVESICVLERK